MYPAAAGAQPSKRPARPSPARPRSSAAARRSPALPTGPRRAATSAATILFFTGVKGTRWALIMFPLARAAQSLVGKHRGGSRGAGGSSGGLPGVVPSPVRSDPQPPLAVRPGTVLRAPQGLRPPPRAFLFISAFFISYLLFDRGLLSLVLSFPNSSGHILAW